jgi:sulfate/thiosulfate-binding protein
LTTFVQRGIGDVLISWENEAFLAVEEYSRGTCEIVTPSLSILAEPSVALVDKVVDRKGTRKAAEAYLQFLYTPQGQEIVAKHHYRPRLKEVANQHRAKFKQIEMVTIDKDFGGWAKAQKTHFSEDGTFDQIYTP